MTQLSESWMALGACADTYSPIFFPEHGGTNQEKRAKEICRGCLVVIDCLEYALVTRQAYGIYGATNPKQRRRMIQSRQRESRYAAASKV